MLLMMAGVHIPVMPLEDSGGSNGTVSPSHIVSAVPKSNAGVMFGLMLTVSVVATAQGPAFGVKV